MSSSILPVLAPASAACSAAAAHAPQLVALRGGGHGGEPYPGRRLIGVVSRELDANETIWQLFSRHRLP